MVRYTKDKKLIIRRIGMDYKKQYDFWLEDAYFDDKTKE